MGGKDVIYVKQQHLSTLQPADVQKRLKEMADKRFSDANGQNGMVSERVYQNEKVFDEILKPPLATKIQSSQTLN